MSQIINVMSCVLFAFRKEDLLKGVYDMGFNKPSKIQESALPMLLADPYVSLLIFLCN